VRQVLPCQDQANSTLEATNLSCVRGNRLVFRNVNMRVASGELVGLVGCNGIGKTTLLHCLAGALRPLIGGVRWHAGNHLRSPAARRLVGFVGHESSLYLALTPRENLLFAGQMWGISSPERRVTELLSAVGLEAWADQRTFHLSRGMRQRLAVARAVMHDPALVLLDEPFNSLDVEGRQWLKGFLCELRKRKRSAIVATHDAVDAGGFMDRVVELCVDGLREVPSSPTQALWESVSA
jgi:heme ABC exporter ATP-binding subunit CcmA